MQLRFSPIDLTLTKPSRFPGWIRRGIFHSSRCQTYEGEQQFVREGRGETKEGNPGGTRQEPSIDKKVKRKYPTTFQNERRFQRPWHSCSLNRKNISRHTYTVLGHRISIVRNFQYFLFLSSLTAPSDANEF